MPKTRPKSIETISEQANGSLRFLLDNLARIHQIDAMVKQKLPDELKPHCRVVNLRANQLVLAVNSATWGTRLKFILPNITSQLRQDGFPGLTNIELLVIPD